jgi:hypothetical protein
MTEIVEKKNWILPFLGLILGTFLGSGSIWQYKEQQLNSLKLDLDKKRLHADITNSKVKTEIDKDRLKLERKNQELEERISEIDIKNKTLIANLERAKNTTQWRKTLEEELIAIINLTHDFYPLDLCSRLVTPERNNTAIELRSRLKLKKQNFERLEVEVAGFEGRDVREINLNFSPPCPPSGLSIN